LLLLLVVVPRVSFVLRSEEGVVAIPIVDDGYYNMTIARNIATGRGFTFDGTAVTTGFHPLVVLIAAPVFAVFGGGTTEPLRVILAAYTLLGTLLAWMIFRVVRRLTGPGPALAAVLLYATAPGVLVNTLNGCDTVIGGVLLLATVWYYIAAVRAEADPRAVRYLVLGMLAGSLGLARLDLGFFAAALGVDLLLVRRRRGRLRPGRLALFAGSGLFMVAPWIVVNLALSHRPLPDNGRAVTLISRAIAPMEVRLGEHGLLRSLGGGHGPSMAGLEPYPDDHPPPAFYRTMVAHAGLTLLRETPITGVADALAALSVRQMRRLGWDRLADRVGAVGFSLLCSLGLAGLWLVLFWLRRARIRELASLRAILFLLPSGLILFLAYPLVVFGQWFFGRYYFPLTIVALLFTAVFGRVLATRWTPVRIAVLVLVFVGAFLLGTGPSLLHPVPRNFYRQAERIRDVLPETTVIGAVQTGHLGFFCPQRVVNLDGKVNGHAYRALKERRVLSFARRQGVQVITEWPALMDLLVVKRSAPEQATRLVRIEPPGSWTESSNEHGWATWVLETAKKAPGR
jgi:hypothetical protein